MFSIENILMASRFQDQERQCILRLLLPLSHPSYQYLSHVFAPSSNKFRVLQFVVSSFCFRHLKATLMLTLLQKRILSIYSKAMLPPSLFQFQELLSQLCFFFFRALKTGIQEHKLMWYCSGMFAKLNQVIFRHQTYCQMRMIGFLCIVCLRRVWKIWLIVKDEGNHLNQYLVEAKT